MAKWLDEGETFVANVLFSATSVPATLYLGLYQNNPEPAETLEHKDITEHTGHNYARKALAKGSWTVANDTASYAQQAFTAVGAGWDTIYGWFLSTTSTTGGKIFCVQHFASSLAINDGDVIKVTPSVIVS